MPVFDYTHALNTSAKVDALKQYVSYTDAVDKAYKKLTELINEVQAKFKESPVYVDGFDVNIGLTFSVTIKFKIRTSEK